MLIRVSNLKNLRVAIEVVLSYPCSILIFGIRKGRDYGSELYWAEDAQICGRETFEMSKIEVTKHRTLLHRQLVLTGNSLGCHFRSKDYATGIIE